MGALRSREQKELELFVNEIAVLLALTMYHLDKRCRGGDKACRGTPEAIMKKAGPHLLYEPIVNVIVSPY